LSPILKRVVSRFKGGSRHTWGHKLRGPSLWRTMYFNYILRSHRSKVLVYPKVHIGIARSAYLENKGKLKLGCCWPLAGYFPSEFVIKKDARLFVTDEFEVLTGFSIHIH